MVRVRVFAPDLELAVADLLVVVEAVVARDRGSDRDAEQIVGPALEAEHLETDEK